MKFNLKQFLLLIGLAAIILSFMSFALNRPIQQETKAIAISLDGKLVAVQGTVDTQVFEISSGRKTATLPISDAIVQHFIEFVDEQHLVMYGRKQDRVRGLFWFDMKSQKQVREFPFPDPNLHESFTPAYDGIIYFDNGNQEVLYLSKNPKELAPLAKMNLSTFITQVDQSLFHSQVAQQPFFNGSRKDFQPATNPNTKFASLLIEQTNRPGKRIMSGLTSRARLSPDGKHFLLSTEQSISLHERSSGKMEWSSASQRTAQLRFSPYGKYVVSTSKQGTEKHATVRESATGKVLIKAQIDSTEAPLAISSQGQLAVFSAEEQAVEVWDAASKKRIAALAKAPSELHWSLVSSVQTLLLLGWCLAWARFGSRGNENLPTSSLPFLLDVLSLIGSILMGFGMLFFFSYHLYSSLHLRQFTAESLTLSIPLFVIGMGATFAVFRKVRRWTQKPD